jgi:tetratricopeptide (TPR) repeat protein
MMMKPPLLAVALAFAGLTLLAAAPVRAQTPAPSCDVGTPDARKRCNAERRERHEKAAADVKVTNKAFEDGLAKGNDAFKAGRVDEAIAAWRTPLAMNPDHPGAAALNRNIGVALRQKAITAWNGANAKPAGEQEPARAEARKTAIDALASALASYNAAVKSKLETDKTTAMGDVRENVRIVDRFGADKDLDRMKHAEPQAALFNAWLETKPDPAAVANYGPSAVRALAARDAAKGLDLADHMLGAGTPLLATAIAYGQAVVAAGPAGADRKDKARAALTGFAGAPGVEAVLNQLK